MNNYEQTLKEVTDMFESCGCRTDVAAPSDQEVVLTIQGPTAMCPSSIFEEHVEKANELMREAYPNVAFKVDVKEE